MNNYQNLIKNIPKEVSYVTNTLEKAGFEAYLVGGCVRDLLMDREPKDWDVTTNAKPEQIVELFEKTVYENKFGTVMVIPTDALALAVKQEDVSQETLSHIEVTPYRTEAKYSDFRHPEEVSFSDKLEDDLKRRDFTVNALGLDSKGHIVDQFEGLKDIKDKVIKTVGSPDERFQEDALRMLRAVRFAFQLGFSITHETSESILKNAGLIKNISSERIRDELFKILMTENPSGGILMLQKLGLLKYIIPELEEGIKCVQGGEHIYDVWEHSLQALNHAGSKNWPIEIRLSALFHDIGKPRTRRFASTGAFVQVLGSPSPLARPDRSQKHTVSTKKKYTFYGHEVVGARMAKKIMERLKFTKKETELVEKLVRNHMFFSDTEQITLSAVRRIITKVGPSDAKAMEDEKENHPIWDLMKVRECDRVGMKKKEAPYRLRKYHAMIEEALRDPISVSQLKVDGEFMIKELGIKPGPRMGFILHALLEEVLEDPKKNEVEYLKEKILELDKLSDNDLKKLGEKGKEKKEELEEEEVEKLHTKHGVHSEQSRSVKK